MRHTRNLASALCVMALIASLPVICSAHSYSITEIPQMTHAQGVNRNGVVVGEKSSPGFIIDTFLVYVHSSGVLNELPEGFAASDINDQGEIIGDHTLGLPSSESPPVAAILYLSGGEKFLPKTGTFFLTTGHAISNSGLFAAGQDLSIGKMGQLFFLPFLWEVQNDSITPLPVLSGQDINLPPIDGDAHGVNDRGIVVGNSGIRILDALGNPIGIATHATRWQAGPRVDLGTLPGGTNSDAKGINDSGEIVGGSDTANGASHAFLLRRNKMLDLGTLGHDPKLNSDANRINDSSEIVGWSQTRAGDNSVVQRAFVSQGSGRLRDLTQLIERKSPLFGRVTLISANAISSNGWIAADGFDIATGELHAYLLIPRDQ